ncbi:MAG: dipeptide ABC transporter ATP-binding protein [Pseudomonadota bacterium]
MACASCRSRTDVTGSAPILELDAVSISYFVRGGEVPAVTGASLALRAGESLGLVGESGCGKSTVAMAVLRYFAGNGRIVGGAIRFQGRDMAGLSDDELRRVRGGGIGMVYQEAMSALNPSLTIAEQLAETAVVHLGADWEAARAAAVAMLKDVKLADIERVMESYPHQLSGGQQQRIVIAMALLAKPSLLLLDEPTTGLDVTVEAGVVDVIAALRAKYNTTLLYISHNLGLIAEVCERVAVMYSGEIVEEGRIEDVFARPSHPYTRGLLACLPLPTSDKRVRPLVPIRGNVTLPQERPPGCYFGPRCDHFSAGLCDAARIAMEVVDAGSGHGVRCVRWSKIALAPSPPGGIGHDVEAREDVVLAVSDLDKHYPIDDRGLAAWLLGGAKRWIKANQKLNFRVRRQQTLAIVGESGCGKSTFAKVLMGLEAATGGEIGFVGVDLAELPVERRSPAQLRALQMVFQNPDETLNPSYSIGAQIARVVRKFGVETDRKGVGERVGELLALTKLSPAFAERRPRQLSGGQKQRVAIARAFAGKPDVVVADEPVSSLDVSVRAAITELLIDIQKSQGTTLVLISHDLSLVRYIADRVVVMYLGQVMESGTADQLFAPPYHPYTEALLSAVPIADPSIERKRIVLAGEIPSALDPPAGCPFHTRCPRKIGRICEEQKPPDQRLADGHRIACHIPAAELAKLGPVFKPAATR